MPTSNETTTGSRILEVTLGFSGTAAATVVIGLLGMWVLQACDPSWYLGWTHAPIYGRLLPVFLGLLLSFIVAAYFWRARRMVSIGALLVIVLDVVTTLS